jgi:hypothetical protein
MSSGAALRIALRLQLVGQRVAREHERYSAQKADQEAGEAQREARRILPVRDHGRIEHAISRDLGGFGDGRLLLALEQVRVELAADLRLARELCQAELRSGHRAQLFLVLADHAA